MAEELKFEVALHLAQSLLTIGTRTYWPDGAIEETAEDLVRWCKGAIIDNCVWHPEAQARELVREARETWRHWKGTAALRELFREKFVLPVERHAAEAASKRPPCALCGSTGWVIVDGRRGAGAQRCVCGGGRVVDLKPVCSTCHGEKRIYTTYTDPDGVISGRWQPCSCVEATAGELKTLGSLVAEVAGDIRPKPSRPTLQLTQEEVERRAAIAREIEILTAQRSRSVAVVDQEEREGGEE